VRSRTKLIVFSAAGLVGLAAFAVPMVANAATQAPGKVFSVTSFGARGDGTTDAAPATDKAIAAASRAGGGTVEFGAGTFVMKATVHLQSNVTIKVNSGSTITGSAGGYDAPESNPNDSFQDYGHSHFHNAMFFGNAVSNVTFTGGGTIDGGGHLITGNPKSGQADKIISITRCTNLMLSNITLRRGGHFAALINGCDQVTSDHLTIRTASDRDGWNIINTSHVTITNADIAANDDALVFKSDWALGKRFTDQGHVRVNNSHLSAGCCNALMFGSETCSDFTDYVFDTITITGASKSGLGMVSMDSAKISDVHYKNITMSGVSSPIMQKIGTRNRCGDHRGVGSISNVTYENVTGTGKNSPQYSPTIWGADSSHQVSNVTFTNVRITVPGGHGSMGTGVPSNNAKDYNPKSIGTRPAYGWYIHNASNITFVGGGVMFNSGDSRPAVIANAASNILFGTTSAPFSFETSGGSSDFVFQNVSGYCVQATSTPRVSASGSSQSC
jgi:polygalacturonase